MGTQRKDEVITFEIHKEVVVLRGEKKEMIYVSYKGDANSGDTVTVTYGEITSQRRWCECDA